MFAGSVLAWGVIGPLLVHYGECIGIANVSQAEVDSGDMTQEFFDKWNGSVTFTSLSKLGKRKPSPRYWLLWPGVMIMVCCALAELAVQYKIIWFAFKSLGRTASRGINAQLIKRGKSSAFWQRHAAEQENSNVVQDPARSEDQVKPWMWISGLLVAVVIAILIGELQWQVNGGLTILALILSFFFAFLCIQIGAVTDQTPLTAASKASQLVFGGATHGMSIKDAQRINLVAGSIASGSADVATALTGDFRTGFLLRTPPVKQWIAQAMGTFVSVFLAPGLFVLFTSAYPCILNPDLPGKETQILLQIFK